MNANNQTILVVGDFSIIRQALTEARRETTSGCCVRMPERAGLQAT